MLGQSEGAEEQRLLMLDEIVGEIEGADLACVLVEEAFDAGEEGITMVTGHAARVGEAFEQSVEVAARAAIAVSDQNGTVLVGLVGEYRLDRRGDLFGPVVKVGWEVFEVDVAPTVC